MKPWETRDGLHDNVPAGLLPRWQKVCQSRATRPKCTDVPDWVTTSAMQPTFWDSDSFNFKCHGRQPWRRVGLGGLSCNPALLSFKPRETKWLEKDSASATCVSVMVSVLVHACRHWKKELKPDSLTAIDSRGARTPPPHLCSLLSGMRQWRPERI